MGGGGKTTLMFKLARELSLAGEPVLTTTTTKIFEPSLDQAGGVILSGSVPNLLDRADELLDKHRHLTAAVGKLPESGKLYGFRPEIIGELWNAGLFQWIIVEADGAAASAGLAAGRSSPTSEKSPSRPTARPRPASTPSAEASIRSASMINESYSMIESRPEIAAELVRRLERWEVAIDRNPRGWL